MVAWYTGAYPFVGPQKGEARASRRLPGPVRGPRGPRPNITPPGQASYTQRRENAAYIKSKNSKKRSKRKKISRLASIKESV